MTLSGDTADTADTATTTVLIPILMDDPLGSFLGNIYCILLTIVLIPILMDDPLG